MQPTRLTFDFIKDTVTPLLQGNGNSMLGDQMLVSFNNRHILSDSLTTQTPFSLQYTLFGFMLQGECVFTINLQPYTVKQGQLFVLNSGITYEIQSCSEDMEFDGCVMSDTLKTMLFPEQKPQLLDRLCDSVVPFTEPQINVCRSLLSSIVKLCHETDQGERCCYDILKGMIRYCDLIRQSAEEQREKAMSRDEELLSRFLRMVNANASKERNIEYYARELMITRNYLSIVVSRVSGITAKEWIERAVIMEAKSLLRFTSMSVLEISNQLNFTNDAFFNKYFKRNVGCTPIQYRRQQNSKNK